MPSHLSMEQAAHLGSSALTRQFSARRSTVKVWHRSAAASPTPDAGGGAGGGGGGCGASHDQSFPIINVRNEEEWFVGIPE